MFAPAPFAPLSSFIETGRFDKLHLGLVPLQMFLSTSFYCKKHKIAPCIVYFELTVYFYMGTRSCGHSKNVRNFVRGPLPLAHRMIYVPSAISKRAKALTKIGTQNDLKMAISPFGGERTMMTKQA